jgi:hypothetical protein
VKAHIIPRAYSNLNLDKNIRVELGQFGKRPKIRHDSWFDTKLVTAEGEKLLAKHDFAFAKQAGRFGFCWRHHPVKGFDAASDKDPVFGGQIYTFKNVDAKAVRIFFLSLLWRAVCTDLPGFKEIRVDVISREKLRKIVAGEVPAHDADFPISLVALTSRGQPQNLSPIRSKIAIPQISDGLRSSLKIFRFFVDGLVAHIGRKSMDFDLRNCWRNRVLGVDFPTIIIGRPYEGSWQEQNLEFLQEEFVRDWPDDASRIYRKIANG